MNNTLNKRFYGVINTHKIKKELACIAASGGRTERSSQLSDREAYWFVTKGYLQMLTSKPSETLCENKRKQLIAMAYDIGEDIDFVKAWVEKYGVGEGDNNVKKNFNSYNSQELYALIKKFKTKVVAHRQKSVANR